MGTQEVNPFGDGTSTDANDAALIAWTSVSRTPPAPGTAPEGPPLSID
ncbi:hypothetical protein ACF1CG_12320 [Streptomyces sp. NPDC014773]